MPRYMLAEKYKENEDESWLTNESIFYKLSKLYQKYQLINLWIRRSLEYSALFLVTLGIEYFFISYFNQFSTPHENALYFLSSMVQAQAAIVALVVTLTLVAIQTTTTSYTPRVVEVMKKNPDMWILLLIYFIAISYGFIVLKMLPNGMEEPNLVTWTLIIGVYTFLILFFYLRNTIAMLRPDMIVSLLVKEINAKNISNNKWIKNKEDDSFQPVFDMMYASINRFDLTTTRAGLTTLSDHLWYLFSDPLINYDENKMRDITKHFCTHLERSTLIAIKNGDEGVLREICDILAKYGGRAYDHRLEDITKVVAKALGQMGSTAADKGFKDTIVAVAESLEQVCTETTSWRTWIRFFEDEAIAESDARGQVGTATTPLRKLGEDSTIAVTDALGQMGTKAADKRLEDSTITVVKALKQVGCYAADNKFQDALQAVLHNLGEVGIHATNRKLKEATKAAGTAQGWIQGYNSSKNNQN